MRSATTTTLRNPSSRRCVGVAAVPAHGEVRVEGAGGHELVVAADVHDAADLDGDDDVGVANRRERCAITKLVLRSTTATYPGRSEFREPAQPAYAAEVARRAP